ncbi:MAG: hypothetical protein AAGF55_15835, partial [Pseudomonadota bacterium]
TPFWQISGSLKTHSGFTNRISVTAMRKAIRTFVLDAECSSKRAHAKSRLGHFSNGVTHWIAYRKQPASVCAEQVFETTIHRRFKRQITNAP